MEMSRNFAGHSRYGNRASAAFHGRPDCFSILTQSEPHSPPLYQQNRLVRRPFLRYIQDWSLVATVVGLLIGGCSWPSDWDRQWEDITHAIREGNLQEAKTRLTGLLPAAQQEGPKNPHYAQIIFQLGTIAQLEGNHQQAEAYFWEALPLWAQSVGPEHPNMADTLLAIAEIFEKKNKSNMALPLLKRAVSIQEKAWGRTDPRLLPSLKQYLHLLELTQQASDAQLIQQQIRHIQEGDRGSIPQ